MTPKRWLDDPNGATEEEREVLRAGLDAEPPELAEHAVWQRLSASLAAPATIPDAPIPGAGEMGTVAGAAPTTALTHATAGTAVAFAKGLALGLGLTVATVGGRAWLDRSPPREAGSSEVGAPVASATGSVARAPSVARPASVPSAVATERAVAPRPAPARSIASPVETSVVPPARNDGAIGTFALPEDGPASSSNLAEETRLLRRARAELLSGSLTRAFATLEASRQKFATPELAQEREALSIELLHRSGEIAAAKQRARAFVERYPESPHAERVRSFGDPER